MLQQARYRLTPGGLAELAALDRLIELVAEHGFQVLPDDPEAGVLRFRGGSRTTSSVQTIEYRLVHRGHTYRVVETPKSARSARIQIEIDGRIGSDHTPPGQRSSVAVGMIVPETANVVLSIVSDVIRERRSFDKIEYPMGERLQNHPRYRIGRFPTELLPDELVARKPHLRDHEIELRDLERWRDLLRRRERLLR